MTRFEDPRNKPLLLLAAASFAVLFALPVKADDAAAIYKAKCVACHAADGSGDTAAGKAMMVVDLRGPEIQKMTDDQLIDATTNGKGKMPAYKGKMTDDQIKQLVAYVRQLAKK
jgi:mono/diheme cytochrome c family protein